MLGLWCLGKQNPKLDVVTQTNMEGGPSLNCVLTCPLLEIPFIVFQADVDALSEVARVRNGPEEVSLDQCDIIELRSAGCTSLGPTWVQENLGMNYGILVVLSYVVIYEDVLNILVKGVDPQRLSPTDGEGICSPPVKVVLKAPQALD